jgi:hypothetical protein
MRGAWQTYHDRDGYRWCWPLLEPWYDHGSVTRRQVRHLCLAGFVALVCAVSFTLTPAGHRPYVFLSLGLGYASLALLLLTLATGPCLVISRPRCRSAPCSAATWGSGRRSLDACTWSLGCSPISTGESPATVWRPAGPDPDISLFGVSNWIGAAATLVLLGLLLLSNNLSLRALGIRHWKNFQRFNYLLAALTVLHTFGYQSVGDRGQAAVLLSVGA